MSQLNINEVVRIDLFKDKEYLLTRYSEAMTARVIRLRDMYNWVLENPSTSDRDFVSTLMARYGIEKTRAYEDLAVIKALLPEFHKTSRDWSRWKYNEMIMETYKMAKARKDTKTMERAATSYAKYNRIDVEDESALPFDLIVVQPFTATDDPSVLGIKRIPNIDDKIRSLIDKYTKESIDIEDIEYEEADLEEEELYNQYEDVDDDQE